MLSRSPKQRMPAGFHFGQLLMTGFDKAGDAACRKLDSEEILQQLTGTSVGNQLAFLKSRSRLSGCLPHIELGPKRVLGRLLYSDGNILDTVFPPRDVP